METTRKILLIDTGNGVYNQLSEQENLALEHIRPQKSEKIYDIAEKLAKKINDKAPEAILINLEGGYENTPRPELKGTELIYWLRLKHKYTGPIITYGFLAPEQILRLKPEYVVIHAPGNRHLRVPFESSQLDKAIENTHLKWNLNEFVNYLPALKSDVIIRHKNANKWALKKLIPLYRSILGKEDEIKIDQSIYEISNLHELISEFLYVNKIKRSDNEFEEIDLLIKDYHKKLGSKKKSILLIDDMASLGWDEFFKKFLNCKKNEFESFEFSKNKEVESIYDDIQYQIHIMQPKPDLILLDLRLKEDDSGEELKEFSGYKILKDLKHDFPEIPIIVVTANNKLLTSKKLKDMGIWDIWIKEGKDNQMSDFDLRYSLLDLLKKVNSVYESLPDMEHRILYAAEYRLEKKDYPDKLKELNKIQFSIGSVEGINLSLFDVCILDTNVWLSNSLDENSLEENDFIKKQVLIQVLIDYFSQPNKEVLIHNFTLSELRKLGKTIFDFPNERDDKKFLTLTADFSLNRIKKLLQKKRLKIENFRRFTYDEQAYADPMIIDLILEKLLGIVPIPEDEGESKEEWVKKANKIYKQNSKNVLFVSDDSNLRFKVQNLKSRYNKTILTKSTSSLYEILFEV